METTGKRRREGDPSVGALELVGGGKTGSERGGWWAARRRAWERPEKIKRPQRRGKRFSGGGGRRQRTLGGREGERMGGGGQGEEEGGKRAMGAIAEARDPLKGNGHKQDQSNSVASERAKRGGNGRSGGMMTAESGSRRGVSRHGAGRGVASDPGKLLDGPPLEGFGVGSVGGRGRWQGRRADPGFRGKRGGAERRPRSAKSGEGGLGRVAEGRKTREEKGGRGGG